jgi:hypothetical protein
VNNTLIKDNQSEGFEPLILETKILVEQNEDRAAPLVWLGIIQTRYAGEKGVLTVLSLAKEANKSLEHSL